MWALYRLRPLATLYVFLLPLVIVTVALSLGNWSQHIFINHAHYAAARAREREGGREGAREGGRREETALPGRHARGRSLGRAAVDSYCMSYVCAATEENQRTFNDGYHTVHHVNSRLHWSELPRRFAATLDAHEAHGVLVFRGIHFMDVGIACTFGGDRGLRWLATKLVPYHPSGAAPAPSDGAADASRLDAVVRTLRSRLRPVAT